MLVKIKTWDSMEKEFGIKSCTGSIDCLGIFTADMERMMPDNRIIDVNKFSKIASSWGDFLIYSDMIEYEMDDCIFMN